MCRNHDQRKSGYSIIELLVVVAIAAILIGIAIPAFNLFIGNTRSTTIANEFVSALNLARSEAMKRGQDVSICPQNTNGTDCDTHYWEGGWLVMVDNSKEVIRLHAGYSNSDDTTKPSVFAGEGDFENATLTYDSSGRLKTPAEIDENMHYFKIENMGKTMCIFVNNAGRVRTEKGPCP